MSEYDRRLNRHRNDLSDLFNIAEENRKKCKTIYTARDELLASDKGRVTAAGEATDRQIQDLKEQARRGEAIADTVKLIEIQTAMRLKAISAERDTHIQRTTDLEDIVKDLTSRIQKMEAIPTRKCTSCQVAIRPTKASHMKCEDCYLAKRTKSCTTCQTKFVPIHYSYKICPTCYLLKKASKAKKMF